MPHDPSIRVVQLSGRDIGSRVVSRALAERFDLRRVVVEQPPSRRRLVTRRAKKLGWPTVVNQLVFQTAGAAILSRTSRDRYAALVAQHGWSDAAFPEDRTVEVPTVNGPAVVQALRAARPDVVVVSGTRIIGKRVLASVDAPFVNMHAGITPTYRGVHGGWWALAEQRPDLCGVTVHLVDRGIDTGGVLAQSRIQPGPDDTYATYPLLQLAAGLPHLLDSVSRLASGNRDTIAPMGEPGPLRFHPTATGYVRAWWRYGVR